ncbi:hypothetical protein OR16_29259 [Cupriavidus basilensis OR16]|uniref:Uncharacterized protein n=2 Tax=Cupriavidus basilensis TaxID=68895 RepID=H1SCB4_9BURK|nr:hypothetical protein OR16_29259 [Cupriavidus basilensis OR16]
MVGALAVFWGPAAHAADLARQIVGPISYVCGGVGEDEQQALKSESKDFDMGLLFTEGARGEYLSDVAITLSRNGVEVASFRSTGPRCLIKAPRATYQVVATYNGVDKHTTLRIGERNVHLNW